MDHAVDTQNCVQLFLLLEFIGIDQSGQTSAHLKLGFGHHLGQHIRSILIRADSLELYLTRVHNITYPVISHIYVLRPGMISAILGQTYSTLIVTVE